MPIELRVFGSDLEAYELIADLDRDLLARQRTLDLFGRSAERRMERALMHRIAGEQSPPPLGVLDARAGNRLPPRLYQTFFELLHVSSGPWRPSCDFAVASAGFSYELERGGCGRLSPTQGVWSDPEKVVMSIAAPPGWRGFLDLYFYQELDWDTPFRVQDVEVDGNGVDTVQDFYGRGSYCDEGVWRSYPVAVPDDGRVRVTITRRGGGDARLSRLVLRP